MTGLSVGGLRVAAALALVLTSGPAALSREAAPDVFGLFRAICLPGLDPAAASARAQAQGFSPAQKKTKAPGLQEARGFEKTVAGRELFVIVGRGTSKPKDGMPASATLACGVGVKGKDEAALAAGRKWVGVPVSRSVLGVAFHAFRQAGGGRTALSFDDKVATKAAVIAGDLNVLTLSPIGGVTLLMLSRTRAVS